MSCSCWTWTTPFCGLGEITILNEEINCQQCRPIKCNSLVLMNSLGKKAIQMTTKVRPSLGPWNEHRSWYLNTFWVVWKTLSYIYIYLGSTGRSFWQIFLKFVTNIPFCNSLDKLFGRKNPIIFSPALAPPLPKFSYLGPMSFLLILLFLNNMVEIIFTKTLSPFVIF